MSKFKKIRKVFLVADIGKGDNNSYHVGDEAMFLQNLWHYQSIGTRICASSRSLCNRKIGYKEVLDIYITSITNLIYLLFCVYLLRYFRLNCFPKFFHKTVYEVLSSERLHISGGGNLNSFWEGHIYYRCLMIILAYTFDKEIILTSQTIGPITKTLHNLLLKFILSKVTYIEVRDNISRLVLKKYGVKDSTVVRVVDDAYSFEGNNLRVLKSLIRKKFAISKKKTTIGISLHDWQTTDLVQLKLLFTTLNNKYSDLCFLVIPHYFDIKDGLDTHFMKELFTESDISVGYLNYKLIENLAINTRSTFAEVIKAATEETDLLISSRYHGLVFAISSNIPVLAINYDKYYSIKNNGFLENFFDNLEPYTISINEINEINEAFDKIKKILKNRNTIIKGLKTRNKILSK